MLEQNMKEARTGEVDINDVDPDALKQILEYIYTGKVLQRKLSIVSHTIVIDPTTQLISIKTHKNKSRLIHVSKTLLSR